MVVRSSGPSDSKGEMEIEGKEGCKGDAGPPVSKGVVGNQGPRGQRA